MITDGAHNAPGASMSDAADPVHLLLRELIRGGPPIGTSSRQAAALLGKVRPATAPDMVRKQRAPDLISGRRAQD